MVRYRKILVAYDGSASAKHALAVASQLARENNSWIKVLAVMPSYAGDLELIGVSNIKATMEGPGRKLLAEAQLIADTEDFHILTNLEQGEPYDKIVHVAEEENCDLIVMGRRGHSNLERELMGGVTARVIGHTTKNVLVVPEHAELHWRNILLATDGSKNSEHATNYAIDLAEKHASHLIAISVIYTNDEFVALAPGIVAELYDSAKARLETLCAEAKEKGITAESIAKEGEPHEIITSVASEKNAGVIILGSHGRKGLHRLLMGSVTERTIGYAACCVLVVH
jgi:nucleotide-binding universal stress UspA family protein